MNDQPQTGPQITPEMQAIVSMDQKRGKIESVVEEQKDRLLRNACGLVRSMTPDNQASLLARTVSALLDDRLAECFKSPEGKLSIFRVIEETLATGLELVKHAYAIPQPSNVGTREKPRWVVKARYEVKRQGFHALLCGGDKPLFKDLRWGTVYTKDKCSIDGESGKVSHQIEIEPTRGPIVGVWVQAEIIMTTDTTKTESEFYPIDVIHNIRDNHSESWKKNKSGPWKDDPIPMAEKTAIKAFCRPWADVKDALAHTIYGQTEDFPRGDVTMSRDEMQEAIIDTTLSTSEPEPEEAPPEIEGPPADITEEVESLSKDAPDDDGKGLF